MDSRQNPAGSKFLNAGIDSLSLAIKAAQVNSSSYFICFVNSCIKFYYLI